MELPLNKPGIYLKNELIVYRKAINPPVQKSIFVRVAGLLHGVLCFV